LTVSVSRHRPGFHETSIYCSVVTFSAQSLYPLPSMTSSNVEIPGHLGAFEQRLRERERLRNRPLETVPDPSVAQPRGKIPNTPLAVSTISFLLGTTFALGSLTFICGGFYGCWFATYQLGFFVASWSAFHWGEFTVTAGWNREKVSVDCEYFFFGP